jgi:hypothetical protein
VTPVDNKIEKNLLGLPSWSHLHVPNCKYIQWFRRDSNMLYIFSKIV